MRATGEPGSARRRPAGGCQGARGAVARQNLVSAQASAGPKPQQARRRSGEQGDRPQPREGRGEADGPWPARREVEGEPPGTAGEPPGDGEQAPAEGLGGDDPGPGAEAGGPAGEVVGHHLDRQPGAVGGEPARRQVLRPTPYLRSRIAFSISAWRRWSASRARASPCRSVMKGW
jgi:hypothetical protein